MNKVMLYGRLGRDPELRNTTGGTPVCTMSVATASRRKSAAGEWEEHVEWHRVVCFGKAASNCARFLRRGREVLIEDGELRTREWEKDGVKRKTTEVIASHVTFVGPKQEARQSPDSGPANGGAGFNGDGYGDDGGGYGPDYGGSGHGRPDSYDDSSFGYGGDDYF